MTHTVYKYCKSIEVCQQSDVSSVAFSIKTSTEYLSFGKVFQAFTNLTLGNVSQIDFQKIDRYVTVYINMSCYKIKYT